MKSSFVKDKAKFLNGNVVSKMDASFSVARSIALFRGDDKDSFRLVAAAADTADVYPLAQQGIDIIQWNSLDPGVR